VSETIEVGSNPSASNWKSTSATTDSNNVLRTSYTLRLVKDEDGRVVVTCPNMQGVITDGENEAEALRNGIEALNGILEARKLDKKYNIMIIRA
jgi:predicted RNase H-like HicB family nuclease